MLLRSETNHIAEADSRPRDNPGRIEYEKSDPVASMQPRSHSFWQGKDHLSVIFLPVDAGNAW